MSSLLKSLLFQAREHVTEKVFFLDLLLIGAVEIQMFCKDLRDRGYMYVAVAAGGQVFTEGLQNHLSEYTH